MNKLGIHSIWRFSIFYFLTSTNFLTISSSIFIGIEKLSISNGNSKSLILQLLVILIIFNLDNIVSNVLLKFLTIPSSFE